MATHGENDESAMDLEVPYFQTNQHAVEKGEKLLRGILYNLYEFIIISQWVKGFSMLFPLSLTSSNQLAQPC